MSDGNDTMSEVLTPTQESAASQLNANLVSFDDKHPGFRTQVSRYFESNENDNASQKIVSESRTKLTLQLNDTTKASRTC